MWAASEDAVTDTQMELLPSFLMREEGWGERQLVTIGLGWGHTDGPIHVTLSSRAADRVGAERMHALIMKASMGSKRAVEDTVTDTQTDHFIIIIAVLCIIQSLVTVASHARHAKREHYYHHYTCQTDKMLTHPDGLSSPLPSSCITTYLNSRMVITLREHVQNTIISAW